MATRVTTGEYRALAEWRYRIRQFLHEGDAAALRCGLEPQQYLLLLALRGLPEGAEPTIRTLAGRLALQHHSAVELVGRMEGRGYVRRIRSAADRRCVRVVLLGRGQQLLERVARQRLTELHTRGTALVDALDAVLWHERGSRRRARAKQRNEGAAKRS
jgi:DNA-binding MarR family transcriptional regulator